MTAFTQQIASFSAEINIYLSTVLPAAAGEERRIVEAAQYSLAGSGKRIRPVLLLASGTMIGIDTGTLYPYAAALEMIHTYSLIHDDLPCMDDDRLRRGRPTCHVMFDEATAVLAGDLLLNQAFELLLSTCLQTENDNSAHSLRAAARIATASGIKGMIGGQAIDLYCEKTTTPVTPDTLTRMHRMKTGALISASLLVPFDLTGKADTLKPIMERYADAIGLAFQIGDDLLDVSDNPDRLGKTPGKDARDGKTTYVSAFGFQQAHTMLVQKTSEAKESINELSRHGFDITFLAHFADYLLERKF